ncbi:MAG: aspartate aminotransferase family protein [Bacteroidia bacterium]|nr:aspartate aminotransferase family protein [Bacteroidia bacterium]
MNSRQLFFEHVAQTSSVPPALEITSAEGSMLIDVYGKKFIDLISGISVSSIGHNHPEINKAIKEQVDKGLHFMVYGEFILEPQVKLAELLASILPKKLSCTYFVNSGSEAVEGALKLAKRFNGRTEIISFSNGYHGSTHGALSVTGNENLKNAFRPLLPDIRVLEFDNVLELKNISERTSCVIIETIQGEAGAIVPEKNFMRTLRQRCNETGTLFILDEIQVGCGRTGKMFAYEHFDVVPDILLVGKAFGGGMPLAAFISSKETMSVLSDNPALGHITTFGGHSVSCAASFALLNIIIRDKLTEQAAEKENLFRLNLKHTLIKNISGCGLLLAVEFENDDLCKRIISQCIENGVIVDSFLFAPECMRIAPPLNISHEELIESCKIINQSIEQIKN